MRRTALLLSFTILFLFLSTACQRRGGELTPGRRAPNFPVTTLSGDQVELEEIAEGKVRLLHFFASWCAPCLPELPQLEELRKTLGTGQFEIVGVAVEDQTKEVIALQQQLGLSFPLVIDTSGGSRRYFKVSGFPESVLVDQENKVIMVVDQRGESTLRLIGPQDWKDPRIQQALKKLFER